MLIDEQPDEALIELARSEQPEVSSGAFEEIVRRYLNKLLARAYCRIRNHDTCDDIVQDTLTAVWKERFVFDKTIAKFSTWLYNILKNQIDKYLRDSQKEREMISLSRVQEDKDEFLSLSDSPESIPGVSESRLARLHEVIVQLLTDDEQSLYKLREIDKMKYEDIAKLDEYKKEGADEATLMKRVERYKHKIIELLEMEKKL